MCDVQLNQCDSIGQETRYWSIYLLRLTCIHHLNPIIVTIHRQSIGWNGYVENGGVQFHCRMHASNTRKYSNMVESQPHLLVKVIRDNSVLGKAPDEL